MRRRTSGTVGGRFGIRQRHEGPVLEPLSLASRTGRCPSPRRFRKFLGQRSRLPLATFMVDALGGRHSQHIRASPLLKPPAHVPQPPVDCVGNHPPRRDVRPEGPPKHLFGKLALGREAHLFENASPDPPDGIVCPLFACVYAVGLLARPTDVTLLSRAREDQARLAQVCNPTPPWDARTGRALRLAPPATDWWRDRAP